jgi:hypothetical protein
MPEYRMEILDIHSQKEVQLSANSRKIVLTFFWDSQGPVLQGLSGKLKLVIQNKC